MTIVFPCCSDQLLFYVLVAPQLMEGSSPPKLAPTIGTGGVIVYHVSVVNMRWKVKGIGVEIGGVYTLEFYRDKHQNGSYFATCL